MLSIYGACDYSTLLWIPFYSFSDVNRSYKLKTMVFVILFHLHANVVTCKTILVRFVEKNCVGGCLGDSHEVPR